MTKEECKTALENMHCTVINTMTEEMSYQILDNLINEHFRLEKNHIVLSLAFDDLYDILYRPEPYKFEDLKVGMWVWDDVEKKCNQIIEILENNEISFYYITESVSRYIVNFEENRFYPLTKAMEVNNE